MTSAGSPALDALENMLETSSVLTDPRGPWPRGSSGLNMPSSLVNNPTDSTQSKTNEFDLPGHIIQGIQTCMREEQRFLNQWFVTILREFHDKGRQQGQVLPPESPGCTSEQVTRDESFVDRFESMEWSGMLHKLGVLESMAFSHHTTLDAIHSQLAAVEQALNRQTRGVLPPESLGCTVKKVTIDDSVAEEVEPTKWSRMSHKLGGFESLATSHQTNLDAIHFQLAAIEQRLKDSAKFTVQEPVTTDQYDALMHDVVSKQEQLLQELQKINSRGHPIETYKPPTPEVAPISSSSNLMKKKRITRVVGREWVKKNIHAFEALRGWTRPGKETDEAVKDSTHSEGPITQLRVSEIERKRAAVERARSTHVLSRIEVMSNFLVILNAIFVGFQADMSLRYLKSGSQLPVWIRIMDVAIAAAFLLELLLKFVLKRFELFRGTDGWWNIFDAFLVASGVIEIFVTFINISILRTLRVVRAFKALRLIKSLRHIKDLRLMLASIVCSASCLFWALVMLTVVLYLFSVFILQGAVYWVEHHGHATTGNLLEYYGTLPRTMLSLFMAISGGKDWGTLIQPLLYISKWYYAVYIFFLLFVLFGIMNILTAIFCESASQIADVDRDIVVQENMANEQSTINELRRVFKEFDENASKTLDEEEFQLLLQDRRTTQCLSTCGLDLHEAQGLFTLLDLTGTGEVEIDEFVNTLVRLKGSARALDLATLMYENKKIMASMTLFMKFVQSQFDALNMHFGVCVDPDTCAI